MSAKPESTDAAPAAKSKKMLLIIVAAVVLVLGAAVAFFMISRQHAGAEEGEEGPAPKAAAHVESKTPPAYLPLDVMVVNLADPGGERVIQIGITLATLDAKAMESVRAYMPTIRSGILLLISQRTAVELLTPEGKEKLAHDILRETSIPFGGGDEDEEESAPSKKKKKKAPVVQYPVVGVLFSSFIVQ